MTDDDDDDDDDSNDDDIFTVCMQPMKGIVVSTV